MPADEFLEEDLDRIIAAIETIEESLGVLADKRSLGRSAYKRDREAQDVVERRFVKMTEAALDVGTVLVERERERPPDSNPATMQALGVIDAVSTDTATEMAQAARFRNVLSHTYGDVIDHDVVYNALQDLDRYRTFVHEVRDYLEDVDAFD